VNRFRLEFRMPKAAVINDVDGCHRERGTIPEADWSSLEGKDGVA
jgi:hypothetical protein